MSTHPRPTTCQEWIPDDPDCEDIYQAEGKECGEPAEYLSCDWWDPATGKPAKPVCAKHKCRHNLKIET